MLGDIEICGWVDLRDVKVSPSICEKIDDITEAGKWYSISTEKRVK